MNNQDQQILVAPTTKLFPSGIWEGFRTDNAPDFLKKIEKFGIYVRRGDVEEDVNYQQIIPQIVLKVGKKLFIHKIPQTGSEARLHDMWPIVLGGHVESSDLGLKEAMLREFKEEINYQGRIVKKRLLGIVNKQDNPVNSVHVGVVWLFEGDKEKFISNNDDGVIDGKFLTVEEVEKYYDKMSYWSKLIFPKIKELVENES